MRVAIFYNPGEIRLHNVECPPTSGTNVLVRVSLCGICGSDIHIWKGHGNRRFPYSPGHEVCAVVEDAALNVDALLPGHRVVINPNLGCGRCGYCLDGRPNLCDELKAKPLKSNGGLADYVSLDHRMLRRIPKILPDNIAVLVEPLSCALHVFKRARLRGGESVLVFGAGAMGVLVGVVLSQNGIAFKMVDPSPFRRNQAERILGAEAIGLEQVSDCVKCDAAIDCSGAPDAIVRAVSAVKKRGTIVMAGLSSNQVLRTISSDEIVQKEITVKGAWLNPNMFDEAIGLAVSRSATLKLLTFEYYRLDEIHKAFERASMCKAHRILIKP